MISTRDCCWIYADVHIYKRFVETWSYCSPNNNTNQVYNNILVLILLLFTYLKNIRFFIIFGLELIFTTNANAN